MMIDEIELTVDVILPLYRPQNYIFQTVESVLSQSYPFWQLHIVDDASGDNVISRVRERFADCKKIMYYKLEKNIGPAGARMHAIRQGKGKVIAFIDQDDLWYATKLERQINIFTADPDAQAVHSDLQLIDDQDRILKNGSELENRRRAEIPWDKMINTQRARTLFQGIHVRLVTAAVRRGAFERIGGFRTDAFGIEEWEFWFRFGYRYKIAYIPEILIARRIHAHNTSINLKYERTITRLASLDRIADPYPFLADLIPFMRAKLSLNVVKLGLQRGEWRQSISATWRLFKSNPFCYKNYLKASYIFLLKFFKRL